MLVITNYYYIVCLITTNSHWKHTVNFLYDMKMPRSETISAVLKCILLSVEQSLITFTDSSANNTHATTTASTTCANNASAKEVFKTWLQLRHILVHSSGNENWSRRSSGTNSSVEEIRSWWLQQTNRQPLPVLIQTPTGNKEPWECVVPKVVPRISSLSPVPVPPSAPLQNQKDDNAINTMTISSSSSITTDGPNSSNSNKITLVKQEGFHFNMLKVFLLLS
jgi:hypothetical protein